MKRRSNPRVKKYFVLLSFIFAFGLTATGQIDCTPIVCTDPLTAPVTIEGVDVTDSFTGGVGTYAFEFVSCQDSAYRTPEDCIHIGISEFTYTLNFSVPVNDFTFILTATGQYEYEEFTIVTDAGTPDIYDDGSCYTYIDENTIYSGEDADGLWECEADPVLAGAGGGMFRVNNPSGPYTSLTISGPGGQSGSLFAICGLIPISSPIVDITHVSCNGACDGEATVLEGPSPPYTYVWDAMAGGGTDPTASDLCAGTYEVEVTDGFGEVDTVEVIITEPDLLIPEVVSLTHASCFGDADGSAEIAASGGTGAYTFDIGDGPVDTGVFTDLEAGTYTITIEDENGCDTTISIEITEPDEIILDEIVNQAICTDDCISEIILSASGGAAPYVYSIDDCVTTSADGTFSDLCPDTYAICVEDDNGCRASGSVVIEEGANLGLTITSFNEPTCYGFTDGSITVETEGGVGEITYTWDPENPIEGSTFNNLGAGTYVVYASDEGDCFDSLVIVLDQPDSLWATYTQVDPLCFGDSTGIIVIDSVYNAQGDLGNISYYWAPNYFGDEGVGVDSAYNMPAGAYTVTINDDNGCSMVLDFVITEPDPLIFAELGFEPAFCRLYGYQSGNGVVFAAASGGVPDYSYDWLHLETGDTSDFSTWGGRNPGNYQITVTDNNGCQLTEVIELDSLNPIAAFTVNSDQLDENCEGTELVIANFVNQSENFSNPNDPEADSTFLWNFNHPVENWIISHDYFEQFDTTYTGEAVYEVCLVALNKNGCADTTCKNLIVHVQPEFIAPNIFTPGNGVNDEFTFQYLTEGIAEFECTIVNRWGRTVAELHDITDSWDGTDQSGDDCTAGIYFYVYKAVSTSGVNYSGQGNVQLVRN